MCSPGACLINYTFMLVQILGTRYCSTGVVVELSNSTTTILHTSTVYEVTVLQYYYEIGNFLGQDWRDVAFQFSACGHKERGSAVSRILKIEPVHLVDSPIVERYKYLYIGNKRLCRFEFQRVQRPNVWDCTDKVQRCTT
jgi:hypothetical protein